MKNVHITTHTCCCLGETKNSTFEEPRDTDLIVGDAPRVDNGKQWQWVGKEGNWLAILPANELQNEAVAANDRNEIKSGLGSSIIGS